MKTHEPVEMWAVFSYMGDIFPETMRHSPHAAILAYLDENNNYNRECLNQQQMREAGYTVRRVIITETGDEQQI